LSRPALGAKQEGIGVTEECSGLVLEVVLLQLRGMLRLQLQSPLGGIGVCLLTSCSGVCIGLLASSCGVRVCLLTSCGGVCIRLLALLSCAQLLLLSSRRGIALEPRDDIGRAQPDKHGGQQDIHGAHPEGLAESQIRENQLVASRS
jgi:hypothetical protein